MLEGQGTARWPESMQWVIFAVLPLAYSCMYCPMAVVVAVSCLDQSARIRWGYFVLDLILSLVQMWILLPAVQ